MNAGRYAPDFRDCRRFDEFDRKFLRFDSSFEESVMSCRIVRPIEGPAHFLRFGVLVSQGYVLENALLAS
jgi:hypothetical protein